MPQRTRTQDPYSNIRIPTPASTGILDKALSIYGIGEEKRRYEEEKSRYERDVSREERRFEESKQYRYGRDIKADRLAEQRYKASELTYDINRKKQEEADNRLRLSEFTQDYAFDSAQDLYSNPTPLTFTDGKLDINSLLTTSYGPSSYNERMQEYRDAATLSGVENPSFKWFNDRYGAMQQQEVDQRLEQLISRRTSQGQSAEDFNISLRGPEDTLVGPRYINMLLEMASPIVVEKFLASTGFDSEFQTGIERFVPWMGPKESETALLPAGETFAGSATKTAVGVGVGAEVVGRVQDYFNKAAFAQKTTVGESILKQKDIIRKANEFLRNPDIYIKEGKTAGNLTPNWKKLIPDELKQILGEERINKIKAKKGLKREFKTIIKEINRLKDVSSKLPTEAMYKPSAILKRRKGPKGPKVPKGGGGFIKSTVPYAAPLAGGWVGKQVAGDKGQIGGEAVGLVAFLSMRAPAAAARIAKMAAVRRAGASAVGAIGGPWGVLGANALMLLIDAGFAVGEATKIYNDYRQYQKTGKINP